MDSSIVSSYWGSSRRFITRSISFRICNRSGIERFIRTFINYFGYHLFLNTLTTSVVSTYQKDTNNSDKKNNITNNSKWSSITRDDNSSTTIVAISVPISKTAETVSASEFGVNFI